MSDMSDVTFVREFKNKYRQVTAELANVGEEAVAIGDLQEGSVRVPTTVGITDNDARLAFANKLRFTPTTMYAEM
eukprot:1173459-Prorocentrum_minimum.AAC.1